MNSIIRYEQKYLIQPKMEFLIKDALRQYISPDENAPLSYEVTSLYFDTKSLDSYWDSVDGNDNRQKFRIRYYKHLENNYFLEVKTKHGSQSKKERTQCKVNPFPYFLRKSSSWEPIHSEFTCQFYRKKLQPCLWTRYDREAFNSKINLDNVRITFDKNVTFSSYLNQMIPTFLPSNGICTGSVILEIKTNSHPPTWIKNIFRLLTNNKVSLSKYVTSCQNVKKQEVSNV